MMPWSTFYWVQLWSLTSSPFSVSLIIFLHVWYFWLESADEHDIPAWIEPAVIILILIANAGVGIYQDYDAENALAALKEMSASHAEALRDGKMQNILAAEIVPGDIIEVTEIQILNSNL